MVVDFRVGAPLKGEGTPHRTHKTLYGQAYGRISQGQRGGQPNDAKSLLALMDAEGITHAVIPTEDNRTTLGTRVTPETLAEFCSVDPERLIGFTGADPRRGMDAVRDLERSIKELGLRGLNIGQFWQEMFPDDRLYYPLYAKCVELGVPVILHGSQNLSLEVSSDYSHPRHIERVATDFPELRIIVTHGGWPWVNELVSLVWRRPNVYVDTAAQRPKYIGMPDTGWGPLLHFGNSVIQDRVLFASRWPLLPFKQTIDEIKELPLKPEVQEKWLWRNAAGLLNLKL
jgi:predicted TIM-barrel fold metal-dependent hydrolase